MEADRPAHVRAASSLAWIDHEVALVQDDANFAALVDPGPGTVRSIALPRGEGGLRQFDDARGNKKYKLDFEGCVAVPGTDGPLLLAFGSGSKRRRRRVLTIDRWQRDEPRIRVVDAKSLYERLEAEITFAGSDMNLEGALVVGRTLRFFGRGNGAARRNLSALNATCDVSLDVLLEYLQDSEGIAPPEPTGVVQYTLGDLDGIALGFTDATVFGESVLYSATAEASEDASEDGSVSGSVLGVIAASGGVRHTLVVDEHERPLREKVEGVLLSRTSPTRVYIVIDADDATRPSELCEVELRGPWRDDLS